MAWIKIFDSVEQAEQGIPLNDVRTVNIQGKKVCIGRLEDGFFAIDDACPHQGASLGMGECKNNGIVECPFHHYLFDLRSGENIGGTEMDVKKYELDVSGSGISINL